MGVNNENMLASAFPSKADWPAGVFSEIPPKCDAVVDLLQEASFLGDSVQVNLLVSFTGTKAGS